ncbi:MAG: Co2+/Mg2+ efflux protein ApaG [Gammaproteobacteria bacterium]|jgi:ApaG protein
MSSSTDNSTGNSNFGSSESTRDDNCGIEINTKTKYLEMQSEPGKNSYAFSYTITIINHRSEPVRLLNRHWIITDQNNKVEEVTGKGVVGQQPLIQPGDTFEYSSGTIIGSEIGDMRGSYTMKTDSGELFEAPIPLFVLAIPNMIH